MSELVLSSLLVILVSVVSLASLAQTCDPSLLPPRTSFTLEATQEKFSTAEDLIVVEDAEALRAYEHTGTLIGSFSSSAELVVGSSPPAVVLIEGGKLQAYDLHTGAPLWSEPNGSEEWRELHSAMGGPEAWVVVDQTRNSDCIALNPRTGEKLSRWSSDFYGPRAVSSHRWNGLVD